MANKAHLPKYLILTFMTLCGRVSASFSVPEEQGSQFFLGYVMESDGFPAELQEDDLLGLHCSFLTEGNPLSRHFNINEATGAVFVVEPIDRETVCEARDTCIVPLDAAVSTNSVPVTIFRVNIFIDDVNDNPPIFPEGEISLVIMEDSDIFTELPIPSATDLDTGDNSVKTYQLDPRNDVFDIRVRSTLDGVLGAAIVLLRKLDREKISSYKLRVLAKDGGSPQRTGIMFVVINIADVNDNVPVMTRPVQNVTITENSAIGTPVIKIKATDADTGLNGQIRYRLNSRTAAYDGDTFEINSTTGEITVISALDYEVRKMYRLVIEAYDGGSPPTSSQALVNINVDDVNDNQPILNINYISGQGHAVISESAEVDSFVAYISVTDKDSGNNAIASCLFEHRQFRLEKVNVNEFQILLNGELDRETASRYTLQIICEDTGEPILSGTGEVQVVVSDVNDNAPIFHQEVFPVLVEESMDVGTVIITLSAADKDEGINAQTVYEIVDTDVNTDLFCIDSATGEVFVSEVLDRETVPEVNIVVTATDQGRPPRRSRTTVSVKVLDVNDEEPKFNQTSYVFSVSENLPADTFIGKVTAFDPDLDLAGEVYFTIQEESEPKNIFYINQESGDIWTHIEIDREEYPIIHFIVVARDMGTPPQSSTASVTVTVTDVNDNGPVIVSPLLITVDFNSLTRSSVVTKLNATDPDFTTALVYSIVEQELDVFEINQTSGEIFLSRNLDLLDDGRIFTLNISVNDSGSPPFVTKTTLILMAEEPILGHSGQNLGNIYIIAIVISSTVLVAVLIVAAIVFNRRREFKRNQRRQQQPANSCTTEDTSRSQTENRVSFLELQHPTRSTCDNPSDSKCDQVQNNQRKAIGKAEVYILPHDNADRVNHRAPKNHRQEQSHRIPEQPWLPDYSCHPVHCEVNPRKRMGSVSELSERTFDSGKGGSEDFGIRGDDSGEKERQDKCYRDMKWVHDCSETVRHVLSGSGEVFIKTANSPWKRRERFEPAILTAREEGTTETGRAPRVHNQSEEDSCLQYGTNLSARQGFQRPDRGIASLASNRPYCIDDDCCISYSQYSDSHNPQSVFV